MNNGSGGIGGVFNWNILILERLRLIAGYYDRHHVSEESFLAYIHSVQALEGLLAGEMDKPYLDDIKTAKNGLKQLHPNNLKDKSPKYQNKKWREYQIRLHKAKFHALTRLLKRVKDGATV